MATASIRPVLHKLIYELRYDYGYTFLDRSGATIDAIVRAHPGWVLSEASPQGGVLMNEDTELTFSFNTQKIVLGHEQSRQVDKLTDISEFAKLADDLTTRVTEHLELTEFTRIGCRIWQLFEEPSMQDAKKRVIDLGYVSTEAVKRLTVDPLDEVSFAVVGDHGGTGVRISVVPVEQQIHVAPSTVKQATMATQKLPREQKRALLGKAKALRAVKSFPQFAVLVDIDSFVEDPPYPDHLRVSSFLADSHEWSLECAGKIMSGG